MSKDALAQLLERLNDDSALLLQSEEATKQGVILPILSTLGWDRDNVREVIPEYRIENGRVDYCLRTGHENAAFIEAKRSDQDLEHHQEQLLDYAFREGVELAVLTNGIVWWLYLPLLGGSWDQRKFFTIDIAQQSPEAASDHFRAYLAKQAVASGEAVQQAKKLHRSREKDRLTSKTLPEAWQQLCEEPDELLVELLAEKVESLCGHKPAPDQTAEFLEQVVVGEAPEPRRGQQQGTDAAPDRPRRNVGREGRSFTGTRPCSFRLFGEQESVSSFKDLLVGVCEKVAARHPDEFDRVLQLKGRTRDYFSREYKDMTRPEKIPGTDLFVEANLSANDVVRRCRDVLRLFGYSEETLSVEVD